MRRIAALLIASVVLTGCRPGVTAPSPSPASLGGVLRVAIPGEVTTLDPWNADAAALVATRQVFETLAAVARGTAGTGPFSAGPGAVAPDATVTLQRNAAYRGRDASGAALPYVDGIVLRPLADPAARLTELRAGRVDLALDLGVAQAAAARGDPSLGLVVH